MGKLKTFLRLVKENPAEIQKAFAGNLSKMRIAHLIPDKAYLKLQYKVFVGEKLNLKNPKGFNAKLQWLKLHDRKEAYVEMVDKVAVKEYVARRIGEEYIIPTLGTWNSFEEIDFDSLPEQFVLKCNHDSGSVVVCRDKKALDKKGAGEKLNKKLKTNMFWFGREWPYKKVKPCIMAEAYMQDETQQKGLTDYKFYCFNGEPKFLYVSKGLEDHATASISFLNMDWTFAPFRRMDFKTLTELPEKPKTYDKMVEFAKKLSAGIPFLRVDMYEIQGKLYFSELTFSPGSGLSKLEPGEYEEIVGDWLILPEIKN